MKDWLDLELEREGLVSRRSEAHRLREERAARADGNDRLRLMRHTSDAEELKLFHARDCDARRLKEEHARAHALADRQAAKTRAAFNGKKPAVNPLPILIGAAVILFIFFDFFSLFINMIAGL